jgi:hypothetical protein
MKTTSSMKAASAFVLVILSCVVIIMVVVLIRYFTSSKLRFVKKSLCTQVGIVCLTRGYSRMDQYSDLLKRNVAIVNAINFGPVKFPLFLFHEGNITKDQQENIKLHTPTQEIKFVQVAYDYPSYYKEEFTVGDGLSNKGYRLMCRFNACQIWAICANLGLTHILRVDEDCILEGNWKTALDKFVKSKTSFVSPYFEEPERHKLTNDTFPLYLQQKYGSNAASKYDHKFAYTNVYMANVTHWINAPLKGFLDGIEEDGGILKYRWGDLPILSVACKMYLPDTMYGLLKGVSYTHGSHSRKVKS